MGSLCADLFWDTLAAPFDPEAKAVPMSYVTTQGRHRHAYPHGEKGSFVDGAAP
jgi:hypothetical protein